MVHLRISLILHVVFDKATLCLRIFHHERFARKFSKLGGRGAAASPYIMAVTKYTNGE